MLNLCRQLLQEVLLQRGAGKWDSSWWEVVCLLKEMDVSDIQESCCSKVLQKMMKQWRRRLGFNQRVRYCSRSGGAGVG
jgi:hypothetical protein